MEENFSPEKYFTHQSFLKKTIDQIAKDFSASGIPIDMELFEDTSFEGICSVLSQKVETMMQREAGALANLLYRIDLHEETVKKAARSLNEVKYSDLLAELIVKRELQKVVIREYYKKNEHEDFNS